MAERGLAAMMGRPVMPHRDQVHAVKAERDGYWCAAAACSFVTDDLSEVAEHVAKNQFVVERWAPAKEPE